MLCKALSQKEQKGGALSSSSLSAFAGTRTECFALRIAVASLQRPDGKEHFTYLGSDTCVRYPDYSVS